jgi:hypothetical protein
MQVHIIKMPVRFRKEKSIELFIILIFFIVLCSFAAHDVRFFKCQMTSAISTNGLGLCVRVGIEALNCQPAPKLNRSTKLQVCTSPRLTQNPCCGLVFFQSFFANFLISCNILFLSDSFL